MFSSKALGVLRLPQSRKLEVSHLPRHTRNTASGATRSDLHNEIFSETRKKSLGSDPTQQRPRAWERIMARPGSAPPRCRPGLVN